MGHAPGKTVLITGASSGIGRTCALCMDRAGWRVFATVRRPSDTRQLQSDASERLHPILLDVTDAAQISDLSSSVDRLLSSDGLDGLVNNAGISSGGLLEFRDSADLRRCLDVNTIAPAVGSQALISLLRKTAGRIVTISSESRLRTTPLVSPYSASKFALEALNDGLRLELKPWNIDVVSVQPGATETPICSKARSYAEIALRKNPPRAFKLHGALLDKVITVLRDPGGIPADSVAGIFHNVLAVKRPKARYLVGRGATIRRWIERLPTSLRDRLIFSQTPNCGLGSTYAEIPPHLAERDEQFGARTVEPASIFTSNNPTLMRDADNDSKIQKDRLPACNSNSGPSGRGLHARNVALRRIDGSKKCDWGRGEQRRAQRPYSHRCPSAPLCPRLGCRRRSN